MSAVAYGEFVQLFTFDGAPQLPVVMPGGSVVVSTPTVKPEQVKFVNEPGSRVGLLVPRGTYRVLWELSPTGAARVDLLVNGELPLTKVGSFPYTASVTTGPALIRKEFLVSAPRRKHNLISLVNAGPALFGLDPLPNSTVDSTSVLVHLQVEMIDQCP